MNYYYTYDTQLSHTCETICLIVDESKVSLNDVTKALNTLKSVTVYNPNGNKTGTYPFYRVRSESSTSKIFIDYNNNPDSRGNVCMREDEDNVRYTFNF